MNRLFHAWNGSTWKIFWCRLWSHMPMIAYLRFIFLDELPECQYKQKRADHSWLNSSPIMECTHCGDRYSFWHRDS